MPKQYREEQDRARSKYVLRMVKRARAMPLLPRHQRQAMLPPAENVDSTYEIGRLIRAARKRMGLTQVEAARRFGVGVRFLHDVEHGKPNASLGLTLEVLLRLGFHVEVKPSAAP